MGPTIANSFPADLETQLLQQTLNLLNLLQLDYIRGMSMTFLLYLIISVPVFTLFNSQHRNINSSMEKSFCTLSFLISS